MFKKYVATAIALTALMSAHSAMAEAPTSQFGFTGWPYRQQTNCNTQSQQTDCGTQTPIATETPAAAADPTTVPSWYWDWDSNDQDQGCAATQSPADATQKPVECPVQESTPTELPQVTPQPTADPTAVPSAVPTAAPTAAPTTVPTAQPTAIPTIKPTAKPTAVPTAVPTATKAPSSDDDYTTVSVSAQEQIAWNLLNQDRIANGLGALTLDPELCRLARLKSEDMRDNNYFAHESPTYGSAANMLKTFGYSYSAVGENIAHHATVEKSEAAFMSSDGHRRNILSTSWTKVGVGVAVDRNGYVYVTQIFVR